MITLLSLRTFSLASTLASALLCCLMYIPFFYQPLQEYARGSVEKHFGSAPISPIYEAKINALAQQMGITQPIVMRKMNTTTMQVMGYYNAFAAFHLFANLLPLVDTPFLFISEGFFEDLPEHEQRFLIGHELTHIKEQHVRYQSLVSLLVFFLLFMIFRRAMHAVLYPRLSHMLNPAYHYWLAAGLLFINVYMCTQLVRIGSLAYRRHIEWQADYASLNTLGSHQGGIDLMERWQRDYKMEAVHPYWGLFADHPSCTEWSNYCKAHKNSLT